MAIPVTVVHQVPGGAAVELTAKISGVKLSNAAVGGFGSAEFNATGDIRKQLGYLGKVSFYLGSSLLWEGQLEDKGISFDETTRTTSVRAFGLRRKLDETSTRRIWSKRDIQWVDSITGVSGTVNRTRNLGIGSGNFDPTNLTRKGVNVTGQSPATALAANDGLWQEFQLPLGATVQKLLGTLTLSGANTGVGKLAAFVHSLDASGVVTAATFTASATLNQAITGAQIVRVGGYAAGAVTPGVTDLIQFEDLRLLGTSIAEDASGGFYGGTILRDLVALMPELSIGMIEDGSDYTIQAIERAVRNSVASVVSEVTGYYTREWAVWEGGRFDWKTRNLDEAQWIVKLADLTSCELDASIDDLARTVYVLYTDAASGLDAEASATATDQRNPYVRQAKTKDMLVTPGFPMTANTSAQLATRIVGDAGLRPSVGGTCTIPATRLLGNAVGAARPAALIRAGENVSFPELPKTDVMLKGRDGETLFHVANVALDVDRNLVTLTLEGQQRRTDVILARLAAATRVLTG